MILKFIIFVFVFAFVMLCIIAYSFYKQLHRVVKRFNPNQQAANDAFRQDDGVKQADGNTIVDHRSSEERNRKVIQDNEGEYVDYES